MIGGATITSCFRFKIENNRKTRKVEVDCGCFALLIGLIALTNFTIKKESVSNIPEKLEKYNTTFETLSCPTFVA